MRPRLLDLFCGAGGCSVGYHRAGFDVVGVDLHPQPNYPFRFLQMDALEYLENVEVSSGFDAIHASPPCQHYAGSTAWRGDRSKHPDLIGPTRELLEATGLPYVIENVPDARRHLRNPLMLCGSAFGLRVRRHRYFETNWPLGVLTLGCHHRRADLAFEHKGERAYADAMGCEWMTAREAREAVPPAYTELIGCQLRQYLSTEAAPERPITPPSKERATCPPAGSTPVSISTSPRRSS
jgi:hypothetical protein